MLSHRQEELTSVAIVTRVKLCAVQPCMMYLHTKDGCGKENWGTSSQSQTNIDLILSPLLPYSMSLVFSNVRS